MNHKKNKIFCVVGPTATGKTAFAIKLAKELDGELISADSRQVYKYLDIGTNKGKVEWIGDYKLSVARKQLSLPLHKVSEVPIHLVSFLDPDKRFSVFDFQNYATTLIQDILSRGKVPIVVGGTGLYIDSLVKGYELQDSTKVSNDSVRSELESLDLIELQKRLELLGYEAYLKLNDSDKKNPRRLVRLIEKSLYPPPTSKGGEPASGLFAFSLFYPKYNWEELKERINKRVDEMFADGLVEETRRVLEMGFGIESVGLQTMGYKQITSPPTPLLRKERGELKYDGENLNRCIELVKTAHRQYARRQRTWFEGKGRGYTFEYF